MPLQTLKTLLYFSGVVIIGIPSSDLSAAEKIGGYTPEELVSLWTQDSTITSLECAWSARDFHSAGSIPVPNFLDLSKSTTAPPTDTSNEATYDLAVIPDSRYRFHQKAMNWSAESQAFLPGETYTILNGTESITFFIGGATPFPNAHISPHTFVENVRHIETLPLRLTYFPFDSHLGVFSDRQFSMVGVAPSDNGESIAILEHAGSGSSVWLNVTDGFILPVKYYGKRDGSIRYQVQIAYSSNGDRDVRTPSSWSMSRLSTNGDVISSVAADVESCRVNMPIAQEKFSVEFPVGTWVKNHITDERYILREGGKKRPVLKGEYTGDNYEELLSSEPTPRMKNGIGRGIGFWTIVVVNVLLVVAIVWLYSRQTKGV